MTSGMTRGMLLNLTERRHTVLLHGCVVGVLHQWGDFTRFVVDPDYWRLQDRPVLGLQFEDDPWRERSAALRLPPWFSNLLPEGRLREWVAMERGVSADREMELLAQVGGDLPGAVTVRPDSGTAPVWLRDPGRPPSPPGDDGTTPHWRFSLAGVGLKLSMLAQGDRLTVPAAGEGGDWIVKLPDLLHAGVPLNEATMMTWAGRAGIDVPVHRTISRQDLPHLSENAWPGGEDTAYAVRRFDRASDGTSVHIEDLAQVRDFYPVDKYLGDFVTVAALLYRGSDLEALREFVRRVTFNVVIGNGDAHLKNWSIIYPDRRNPTIAPVYDLVCTAAYAAPHTTEDLGLKFFGRRQFAGVALSTLDRLEDKLQVRGGDLADVSRETATALLASFDEALTSVQALTPVHDWLDRHVPARAAQFGAR